MAAVDGTTTDDGMIVTAEVPRASGMMIATVAAGEAVEEEVRLLVQLYTYLQVILMYLLMTDDWWNTSIR